ncbi:MAG: J domain-containing protein [Pseudomonadota bacterium]
MVVISAVVLGLSVLATVAKFLDWFMHSDPRTMVRTMRWMLLLLLLCAIPLIVIALSNQQWSLAMLIGAGMLIVPTLLKWRVIFAPVRGLFDRLRPKPRPFDMEVWPDDPGDPETVRRAAAVLEAYVSRESAMTLQDRRRTAGEQPLSRGEALEVLGLEPGCDEIDVRTAHRRLMRLVHPDRGGSPWLARKVSEARDTLLDDMSRAPSRMGDDDRPQD